jgi:Gpi18-like mannosyltransferase
MNGNPAPYSEIKHQDRIIGIQSVGPYVLLSLAILLPLYFFHSHGTSDVSRFLRWIADANRYGLRRGYILNTDCYPPIMTSLLYLIARIGRLFHISEFTALKTSLVIFLFSTSLILFAWTRSIAVAVMAQLTLVVSSVALGYTDIFFAPTLVAALWALSRGKLAIFSAFFALSCLTKLQPLILAPFLLVYLISYYPMQRFIHSLVFPAAFILAILFSIFGMEIYVAFTRAFNHPQLSANAMNLNWILTYSLHRFDPQTYGPLVGGHFDLIQPAHPGLLFFFPRLIFAATYALILIAFIRRPKSFKNLLLFSLLGYLCYFTLNTGVHENHLFLASLLGVILYFFDHKFLTPSLALAFLANLNLFLFYGIDGNGLRFDRVIGIDVTVLASGISLILFGMFLMKAGMVKRNTGNNEGIAKLLKLERAGERT